MKQETIQPSGENQQQGNQNEVVAERTAVARIAAKTTTAVGGRPNLNL